MSVSVEQLKQDLEKVIQFLEQHQIPYLLIGGLALSWWGRPRTTLDLDFLVQVEPRGLEKMRREARRQKFRIDTQWAKDNPLLKDSQVRLRVGQVAVDLMAPRDDQDRAAFDRGKRHKIETKYCTIIAPEDLILQKLKVGRPRDFEDALSILERMKTKLDKAYLKNWAKKLGIGEELHYILSL